MKAFVTGATGFIGSHIAEKLLAQGWDVDVLVRAPDRPSWLDLIPKANKVPGSLDNVAALERAVERAELIIHSAGRVQARSEGEYDATNVDGTCNLLEAARRSAAKLTRFVHISSQAAGGPSTNGRFVTENDPPGPITPYGRSKLSSERVVQEFGKDVPFTIIRPPAVYGPRDRGVYLYFKLAANGFVPVVGSPQRQVSLVHVHDLVAGTLSAAGSAQAAGETYYLTSGHWNWEELSSGVIRAVGRGRKVRLPAFVLSVVSAILHTAAGVLGKAVVLDRHKAREILQAAWLCSHAKASEHFGYTPAYDLDRGMQETARWYREQGWIS